jgi:hypothetical protein
MVVLKDVCRIESADEGIEVLRWAARALLRAGLAEGRARKRAPARRTRANRA